MLENHDIQDSALIRLSTPSQPHISFKGPKSVASGYILSFMIYMVNPPQKRQCVEDKSMQHAGIKALLVRNPSHSMQVLLIRQDKIVTYVLIYLLLYYAFLPFSDNQDYVGQGVNSSAMRRTFAGGAGSRVCIEVLKIY